MGIDDPNDLERIDREIRINELKENLRETTDGEMVEFTADDCPPEIQEQFWQSVVAWENAPDTSNFKQLQRDGLELPAPDQLSDEQLPAVLQKVIEGLARRHVYLENTNHLSDRELYVHLWEESLREVIKDLPPEAGWHQHVDILGSGSEEDILLRLKYYADDKERQSWLEDFPDYELPEHVDPPFDRDRHLPQPPRFDPSDYDPE
jgi:hypothetical protein